MSQTKNLQIIFKQNLVLKPYVLKMLTRSEQSFVSQLWMAISPMSTETGRFIMPKILEQESIGPICESNWIVNIIYFVTQLRMYDNYVKPLYVNAKQHITNCENKQSEEQFISNLNNHNLIKSVTKHVQLANHKRKMLCSI